MRLVGRAWEGGWVEEGGGLFELGVVTRVGKENRLAGMTERGA